jgi:hypothetical protein
LEQAGALPAILTRAVKEDMGSPALLGQLLRGELELREEHAMRKDADVPPTRLKGKKYMKSALVIIDEVGFETFTREEANLFFRLVNSRYQRGSLCITSNKAIKDWPEVLAGDEVITTAILDRLLHSCHVLNIRGRAIGFATWKTTSMGGRESRGRSWVTGSR